MNALAAQLRWHVKKLARHSCLAGSALLSGPRGGVHVLTYHRIADAPRDPFAVAPAEFARQMEWISRRGLAVSLDDVLDYRVALCDLPEGSVLVTIDDGYESLHRYGLPILRHCRVPAVAFVPAGLVEQTIALDPEPRMNWAQVRELAAAGIEIGSHGWSHRSFGRMSAAEMREEAAMSRNLLAEHTDSEVRTFAYPYGTRADFDSTSTEILVEAGYQCAFTSQHGSIEPSSVPHLLPRVKVEGGEGIWAFAQCCQGGLDAWRFVDRCLWAVQARHS